MKKITNRLIIFSLVNLINIVCFGQLPLQYGDAVITHSPNTYYPLSTIPQGIVLRVVHTSNTLTAPLGYTWNIYPNGTKPANDFYLNWDVNVLGNIFGITLDDHNSPNIYVSSTQIYTNTTINKRQIWRIDGITGANTKVFDFNNISGVGFATSARSLGNLKYLRAGSVENIYVSDWETQTINRITGNSAGISLWANQNPFTPKFGKPLHDPAEMAYGLAVKKLPTGNYKLYYAKISTNNNNNSIGGYGNNEIWSVGLDAVGDFIPNTEIQENIPNINRPTSSWGGYSTSNSPSYTCSILPVISDIAFTNDGNKMLVGQQSWGVNVPPGTWGGFGALAPHNSEVREFVNIAPLSSNWTTSGNLFPSGMSASFNCTTSFNGNTSSAGGVSYSSNVVNKDSLSFGCDATVWFTSDYINVATGNTIYGLQGMDANGGTSNTLQSSIWIDADDYLGNYDKLFLGDVEVYKNPNCPPICACGHLTSLAINSTVYTNWPPQTFNQGSLSGILYAYYHCSINAESCIPKYTWQVTSNGSTIISGTPSNTNYFDLTQLNTLPCGTYTVAVTPSCGTHKCDPATITINIVCSPPCVCGQFDSLVLHNNMGVNTVYTTTWPNLTFTGVASGIIYAFYHCNPSNVEECLASYTWQVTTLAGVAVNLPASCLLNTNSFDLSCLNSVPCNNSYKITVTPKCGTVSCESKSFTVKLDCLEPLCSCAGSFSVSQSAVNVVTQNNINNNSPSSSVTTNFTLTSAFGSPSVTEVRMLVDEFRLTTTTGNDNCILCKNKPQTWGSINSATLTGVLNTLFSTPPFETNMRELTFNNGGTPFTLNGNVLNLNLGVPGVTGLNCCTLKAEVCVKFIIRDINCCEREIMKCFTFNLQ